MLKEGIYMSGVRRIIVCVFVVLLLFASGSEVLCASSKKTDEKTEDYDFVFVNNSGWTIRNIWIRHPASSPKGE